MIFTKKLRVDNYLKKSPEKNFLATKALFDLYKKNYNYAKKKPKKNLYSQIKQIFWSSKPNNNSHPADKKEAFFSSIHQQNEYHNHRNGTTAHSRRAQACFAQHHHKEVHLHPQRFHREAKEVQQLRLLPTLLLTPRHPLLAPHLADPRQIQLREVLQPAEDFVVRASLRASPEIHRLFRASDRTLRALSIRFESPPRPPLSSPVRPLSFSPFGRAFNRVLLPDWGATAARRVLLPGRLPRPHGQDQVPDPAESAT